MRVIIISFAFTAIAFAMLMLTLLDRKYRKYYVTVKMFNSMVFVANLSVMTVLATDQSPFTYLMPGFILCFVGDLAMGLHNKYVKKKYLMVGTLLFLLGHICFLSYFFSRIPFKIYDLALPVAGIITIFALSKLPVYKFGKFVCPGMIYAAFVCCMAQKSIQIALMEMSPEAICIGIGGLLFLSSDALIAPLYFRKKRAWAIHGFNIGTYYLAMFFLAISVYLG